jgi:hypothetical protein
MLGINRKELLKIILPFQCRLRTEQEIGDRFNKAGAILPTTPGAWLSILRLPVKTLLSETTNMDGVPQQRLRDRPTTASASSFVFCETATEGFGYQSTKPRVSPSVPVSGAWVL